MGERKGTFSRKQFEENIWEMMQGVGILASNFKTHLEQAVQNGQELNRHAVKLSKYCDQMLLDLIRVTPVELMDTYMPGYTGNSPLAS